MAEASTIGFTTDSVDEKSSTRPVASDLLKDPRNSSTRPVASDQLIDPGDSSTRPVESDQLIDPGKSSTRPIESDQLIDPGNSSTRPVASDQLIDPGNSSARPVASDQLIDPYCEICHDIKEEKVAVKCLCENCNWFLCASCHDVHKQMQFSQRHTFLRGSRMPKSLADKPIKYPDCELHNGKIQDRYCREHHEMLCSECLKQNHQRCHVDTITDLCKILGSDDIKSFTAMVDNVELYVQNTQSMLQNNISDLTKEQENEIKRAEQAKQDMIQKANEMFNETVSGITKHYHNKVGEIKSHIVGFTDELHDLDEIRKKLNRKVSTKFDPNLFIQMQQIVDTTQTCKREIDDMISEINTTNISFSFSKEISDFLACKSFGDVQEISSPLSITDDVGDIFFPYITSQAGRPYGASQAGRPYGTSQAGRPYITSPAGRSYITSQSGRTILAKKNSVDISHIIARKMSHVNITSPKDNDQPWVGGLAVTDNGTLLVGDCSNATLKVFSQDNTLLSSVPLSAVCNDVTVTEDDTAVVSTRDKTLHYLDITNPPTSSVQRSVSLGYTVWGITTYKDRLVVTACTTPRRVRMIDMNGKVVWSVTKGPDNQQLFDTPLYIVTSKINDTETVIVSDCDKETLTLLNANNGSLLKIVDMKGKDPRGITVDNNGNIFVACYKTREICVWSNDFTQSRTLISGNDLEREPREIAYSRSTDTLYIGYYGVCDYIERFQLSMADQ